ncbi:hypothetical protein BDR04DRAFT_1021716, partial [Suillus decipiens]
FKHRYPHIPKKKNQMITSIASQEAMEHFVEKVITACAVHQQNLRPQHAQMSPSNHHLIAKYAQSTDDLTVWLIEQRGDPSFKDFIPHLKDHLLTQLQGLTYDRGEHDFSDANHASVLIIDNKLYHHSILCVNYMTYSKQQNCCNVCIIFIV